MAGNSGSQGNDQFNPWMTAEAALGDGSWPANSPLDNFGAACWYFAASLTDNLRAAGKTIPPIGLADTGMPSLQHVADLCLAIGGQRIEEYMDNTTISRCKMRTGEDNPKWDGPLWGKMVVPFVDMTVKGFLWYQVRHHDVAIANNCREKTTWVVSRATVSATLDTVAKWLISLQPGEQIGLKPPAPPTHSHPLQLSLWPRAAAKVDQTWVPCDGLRSVEPVTYSLTFMQTGSFGVLPSPAIPNSVIAQAYDLDDPWGPGAGPCISTEWACCEGKGFWKAAPYNKQTCAGREKICAAACKADLTPVAMGGIHPRDKKPLGDRLGKAFFNTWYGGNGPATGPTIAGCSLASNTLTITFNTTLLKGDKVIVQDYNKSSTASYLEVQTDPGLFCYETIQKDPNCQSNRTYQCERECPSWAGGSSETNQTAMQHWNDSVGWQPLNITAATDNTITVDVTPLGNQTVTAVRYAWGLSECCDKTDPMMYVTKSCGPAACPLMGASGFPANPFSARVVNNKCQCVAPQVCDA